MNDTANLSLPRVTEDTPDARAREVLEAARAATGGIPNMYAGMANLPALLDTYLHGYQLFRKESTLTPAEQELVLLVISRANECTYCVAAHSWIADKVSKTPHQAIQAVRDDEEIEDPKLQALAEFTRTMVVSRGNPTQAELRAFVSAGYTTKNVLEIILALGVKTISNYSNHLLHTEVDAKFESAAWAPKA
ncbi:Alkylhydroperoxidase [Paraburkholderia piptadeniae]|uniref:Alkylhydroperoxidase n=1 Tax=Paraburkholderia piptadeniae TaxID=1701573 RepID=A0A1N7S928_9BURK|nr:carboxymuconolactone decarboxylase family protein [Paraburkholderia piptadeniae]SIT43919.1 Alkylhydroperoxidase [Paraburkholderia piptadeniae]